MNHGTIMNIQKYSIHDGPGIRTTVFLKGCPLECWWCHNPESINLKHEIMFWADKCTGCRTCIKRCSNNAIKFKNSQPVVDQNKCTLCGICTDFCFNNARDYIGEEITVQELITEILKDQIFYQESKGGVTFSGGEPLVQVEFLNQMLIACKERNIHTAVDTSGYTSWENYEKILDKVDLFLYDLKLINDQEHEKYTTKSNKLILDNLKKLSDSGNNIFIRMPIIAGINDHNEHILNSIKFLKELNIIQVNLLPYHKMGQGKYKNLKKESHRSLMKRPSDEKMKQIASKFKKSNLKVKIGG